MTTDVEDVDFGEHGVIYITSDNSRQITTEWTIPAIKVLLRVLLKQMELFMQKKVLSKRRIFDNTSEYLAKKGFNYTTAQCENKWKSLKRRYMTKYDKLLTGQPSKNSAFDEEITAILRIEKPSFQRETDEISKVNLNIPPGFTDKHFEIEVERDEDDIDENFEQYCDPEEQGYSTSDEKLVELVLQGSSSLEELKDLERHKFGNNQKSLSFGQDDNATELSSDEQNFTSQNSRIEHTTLIREVRELRKTIKRSLDHNTELLKTNNATHEQLLISLDSLDKREEEKMGLKRQKLEKQSELLQQVKIQNSLIAKLIQKIGNMGSTR